MIRELANHRPPDYAAILRWPMREALLAYSVKVRAAALEDWRRQMDWYTSVAPHSGKKTEAPKIPRILRGD